MFRFVGYVNGNIFFGYFIVFGKVKFFGKVKGGKRGLRDFEN